MIVRHLRSHPGSARGIVLGCLLLLLPACVQRIQLPPMGDPLPSSAQLDVTDSIKKLTLRYTDSCGQLQAIPIGWQLDEALQEGMRQTFKTVVDGNKGEGPAPDHLIHVDLVDSSFTLNKDALYDRVPTQLRLSGVAKISNRAGEVIKETTITTSRHERLRLEQLAKNCNYVIDPFVQEAVVDFATRVSYSARAAASGQEPPLSVAPPPAPPIAPPSVAPVPSPSVGATPSPATSASSALRFKALLLDENSNLIFEGGEHLRVRVDVVNTGSTLVDNASALLTGTPTIIEQFPATSLKIPSLQPGQTKSVEFIATLPVTVQPLQVEIHVGVAEAGGTAAPSQTLPFTIGPASGPK